jgi:hypothetical protein
MASQAKARGGIPTLAAAAAVVAVVVSGCGDDQPPERPKTTGSHVWRSQTDMLFEAREQAQEVDAQLRAQEAAIERARRGER